MPPRDIRDADPERLAGLFAFAIEEDASDEKVGGSRDGTEREGPQSPVLQGDGSGAENGVRDPTPPD